MKNVLLKRAHNLSYRLLQALKTVTRTGVSSRYAVVNRETGEHVANVDSSGTKDVTRWVGQNLDEGEWLMFAPSMLLIGIPNPNRNWWQPTVATVWVSDNGRPAWRESKGSSSDMGKAPRGYRKRDQQEAWTPDNAVAM